MIQLAFEFQVAFGTLLFVYFPNLDPYPGYTPVPTETSEDYEYEELPGGEQICPERHANLIDSMSLYALLIPTVWIWLCIYAFLFHCENHRRISDFSSALTTYLCWYFFRAKNISPNL